MQSTLASRKWAADRNARALCNMKRQPLDAIWLFIMRNSENAIRQTAAHRRLRTDTNQSSGLGGVDLFHYETFHLTADLDKSTFPPCARDIPRCASCFSNDADEFAAADDVSIAASHPSLGSI